MELEQIDFTNDNEMLFHDAALNITVALNIIGTVAFQRKNPDVTIESMAQLYFDAVKEFIQSNFQSVDEFGFNALNTREFREYMQARMSTINVALILPSTLVRMTGPSKELVDNTKKNLPTSQVCLDIINSPKAEVPVYEVIVDQDSWEEAKKTAAGNATESKMPWWKKIFK
ncbi:MAG: hypothetical protein II994_01605 [Lachnospiraceae bacterium]|nr:hypothetical protein [Lachnospiraceae bacterium]